MPKNQLMYCIIGFLIFTSLIQCPPRSVADRISVRLFYCLPSKPRFGVSTVKFCIFFVSL